MINMLLSKANSFLKSNSLLGYIDGYVQYIKQKKHYLYTLNARKYNNYTTTTVSPICCTLCSNENKSNTSGCPHVKMGRSLLYLPDWNRKLCTNRVPEDANVFGDLAYEKYKRVEMDEAEEKDERFTENDVRVPRWQKLTPVQYCRLIKDHISKGNLELALSVLDLVKQNRDKPSLYMYGLLIYGFAHKGEVDKCFKLFNKVKKSGLVPNQAIYNSLINACALSKDTSKALEYLYNLRRDFYENKVVVNKTHYISLIKAYSWHKQITTAFEIADEAKDKRFVTSDIYAVLFHAAISNKKSGLKYALILWHQMRRYKMTPTVTHYNLLLRALRDTNFGDLKLNDFLISNLPNTQIVLNETGKSDLLNSPPQLVTSVIDLIKDQSVDSSKGSIVKNIDSEVSDTSENNIDRNKIISVDLNKILQTNRLILFGGFEKLLERMESDNVIPDVKTMTLFMELLPPSLKAEEQLLKYVEKKKIEVDISFYNMLIKRRNIRKLYREAKDVLYEVQRHHLSPNIMTFGVLALGCPQEKYGRELLKQMDNIGFKPNCVIVGTLIFSAAQRRNFKYLQYLMNYMLENDVESSPYIFQTLEKFEQLILQFMKNKNRYMRKDIQKTQREYNSFKIFYEEWKEKIQSNSIVKVSRPAS
ncbi:pentatricopeptide repeat-containing protein 1, mitochondrial isoform X1 [Nomia melanderi]|uniref:pentatricopeptide repeat-containing protein 1, mitochondrial isoform X1 n=2 Tax=Nomia melanderi TaxID=2448451 RepID=UPI003FCDA8D7